MDGAVLEQVSEFKYLGRVLNESSTDDAECRRKVAIGRKVAGAIRSLVYSKGPQLECARVLHEGLLVPALLYGSETMIWRENERSSIRAVQMGRMDGILNARIRKLGVAKGGGMKVFSVGSVILKE